MGRRRIFPTLFLIFLLLAATSIVGGQDNRGQDARAPADPLLEEARGLVADGKLQDAAAAYTTWLTENVNHPEFGLILIEAADSQLSVERALELLRMYTPRVQDPLQQELCRASQIDLLEMLGRTEQALGLLRSFPPTPRWLYRQAQLLFQQGLAEDAEKSLEKALEALLSAENGHSRDIGGRPSDPANSNQINNMGTIELEVRIRLLQARIYSLQAKAAEAENLFQLLSVKFGSTTAGPGILLAYYEYLRAEDRLEEAARQLERLARDFPRSPELALAGAMEGKETIGYAPTPSRLLPKEQTVPDGSREGVDNPTSPMEPEQGAGKEVVLSPPPEVGSSTLESPTAESPAPEEPAPESSAATGTAAAERAAQNTKPEARPNTPTGQTALRPPSPTVLVQTGSFQDRENAQYMVRDLEASGFQAGIVEKQISGTLYFRVVIGPPMTLDKAQGILMTLKDARFEGVLLFPE